MRVRVATATALTLVLVACSGGDGAESSSSSSAATSSTTTTTTLATTTTTTAPTTTTSASVPVGVEAEWKLSIYGLGPIRVGMSVVEAETAAGILLDGEPDPAISEDCYHVVPRDVLDGVAVMVVDDEIARVEVGPPSLVTTLSGARLGSTLEDLQALWPERLQDADEAIVDGRAVAFVPTDAEDQEYRVVFELDDDDTVTRMRAGILPAVNFGEGCL